ncbi:MAG TPA: N-acetylmuramoyl-L-alanine amidase [Beijerinckiaceae bacterium]|nr:N-acetylmuramoyl-L-alanine amidase [Beijerinckiaceae bacterium]
MSRAPLRALLALCALIGAGEVRAAGAPDPLAIPVAIAAELRQADGATRLTFTLSHPVEARAFVMERPDRVVIDLPEVNFQLPGDSGRRPDGVVASFRYGLFAPGRSRVVVDLAQPARVARVETVRRPVDGASLLTLEFARVDRDAFRAAARAEPEAPPKPVALPRPRSDKRPVIVLDPGHGGVDPGAMPAAGVAEKDIVFAFAQRLRQRLQESGRYRVVLTREQDVFVSLDDRVRIAREAGADLMISIHADSISTAPYVRGLTVYTGSERASDLESARLAERENTADAAGGVEGRNGSDEVADILHDLTLRETRGLSNRFAGTLVGALESVMRLNRNPHRQAGFRVLRAADIPAVLLELGYLSSPKDMDLLTSDEWRDRSSAAMASAIERYFESKVAHGPAIVPAAAAGEGSPAPVSP